LRIFDILGNEVAVLNNSVMKPGIYDRSFKAANLSSGIYFALLEINDFIQTKKLILLK
jgi:hypothetical protein